jgi:FKBP-type peptidyl-prolyl cis-trans isomerase FklB
MKPLWTAAVGLALSHPAMAADADKPVPAAAPASAPAAAPSSEKLGYALGQSIGKSFKAQGVECDLDALVAGLKDAMAGSSKMTEDELNATLRVFQQQLNARQADRAKAASEKNRKEGEAFLETNKAKEGVKVTASGLQYKILKAGDGKVPAATDMVTVHYRGTLIDGTEFDSSFKRNEPAKFQVGGVIKGWTEALQLMPAGSKWQLFIPAGLAYGDRGAGPLIGPGAVLVFEVELISIP